MRKKEPFIQVIYVQPLECAEVLTIQNTLEAKQKLVKGFIECIMPFEEEVAIICNEESMLQNLPPNRGLYDDTHELQTIIRGPFFLCYAPSDSEHFHSLPNDLLRKYGEMFFLPEVLVSKNDTFAMMKVCDDNQLKHYQEQLKKENKALKATMKKEEDIVWE